MTRRSSAHGLGTVVTALGGAMTVVGAIAYAQVHRELKGARITVAKSAPILAGKTVSGPVSAYAQAVAIDKSALAATGGRTYAELESDHPARETAMSASFLRASLFTSVIAFGVAAMAAGLGLALVLLGRAVVALSRPAPGARPEGG